MSQKKNAISATKLKLILVYKFVFIKYNKILQKFQVDTMVEIYKVLHIYPFSIKYLMIKTKMAA